ncbi:MFS transporter [Streptomyces sp. H10-C2]|uniref:MFS transporter n=1 Tax=unclassified Streptomyces TaxID=2593676 RepID=UPI0024B9C124|nr:MULTISPECIES: MFS transporter [unclassified Streptomyces]MDJ0342986.1 MFS transporter [Streptomyces sp. PH10-H1]MDJ0371453.1 MFS transporter [Streptomyces sp. H10-C2]
MRLRLVLLALGTFAVGTDAMVVAGILPLLARDLDVPVAAAGQIVTVFALAYALLAPLLATVTARWPRRRLLLTGLVFFTLANVLTALAPDYPTLLATRVLAAAGAAMYTPTAVAVATMMAAPERRGRALALVMGGMTVSTALGVPLGTWLGRTDWRLTMWLVAGLGAAALAGLATMLPALPTPKAAPGLRDRLAPLRDRRVFGAVTTTFLFFVAVQSVYIYTATLVAPATGGSADRLSLLLFVAGLASVAGNWLAGRVIDRFGARAALVVGGTITALVQCALPWGSLSMTGMLICNLLGPLAGWGLNVALQHRLSSVNPGAAPLLLSLNSSALYLGTAAAGGVGSAAIAVLGTRWFPLAAAALAALATILAAVTSRAGRAAAIPAAAPGVVAPAVH